MCLIHQGDRHQRRSVTFDLSLSPKVVLFVAGNKPERDRKGKEETESSLKRARRISQGCWRRGGRQTNERERKRGRERERFINNPLFDDGGRMREAGGVDTCVFMLTDVMS